MQPPPFNLDSLYGRASKLGGYAALNSRSQFKLVEWSIKFEDIDPEMFSALLYEYALCHYDYV